MSSACEVDIAGVVGMHALRLASETPSALLDWNNNYGNDPDKAVCFHCSNLPKHFFAEVKMDFQANYRRNRRQAEHLWHLRGTGESRPHELRPFLDERPRRQDSRLYRRRRIRRRPAKYFRRRRCSADPQPAGLLRYICERGFEHHVAANLSTWPPPVRRHHTYLGWAVLRHAS